MIVGHVSVIAIWLDTAICLPKSLTALGIGRVEVARPAIGSSAPIPAVRATRTEQLESTLTGTRHRGSGGVGSKADICD